MEKCYVSPATSTNLVNACGVKEGNDAGEQRFLVRFKENIQP
jgi:hypothetical protein